MIPPPRAMASMLPVDPIVNDIQHETYVDAPFWCKQNFNNSWHAVRHCRMSGLQCGLHAPRPFMRRQQSSDKLDYGVGIRRSPRVSRSMVGRARFGTSSCIGRAAIRVPTFYPAGSISLHEPYPDPAYCGRNVPRVGPKQGRGSIVQQQFNTQVLRPAALLPFIPLEHPNPEPRQFALHLKPGGMKLLEKRVRLHTIRRPVFERKDQSLGFGTTRVEPGRDFIGEKTDRAEHGHCNDDDESSVHPGSHPPTPGQAHRHRTSLIPRTAPA